MTPTFCKGLYFSGRNISLRFKHLFELGAR